MLLAISERHFDAAENQCTGIKDTTACIGGYAMNEGNGFPRVTASLREIPDPDPKFLSPSVQLFTGIANTSGQGFRVNVNT